MTAHALAHPIVSLPLLMRGKVREVYEVDAERLLLLASDRISAFDVVLEDPIPFKGAVLTQLTAWWLRHLEATVPHHMISADADEIIAMVPSLEADRSLLVGRAMLCRRANVFPVECVVRGYIAGSAWKEYRHSGTLAGEPLPTGLQESSRLDQPIFSPATKATSGHDENITVARMREIIGADQTAELEQLSRKIYRIGSELAAERGIIVADTKFEFGVLNGRTVLVDEVLTPDSSRFWPANEYSPGRTQRSFDKQPLRDYLDAERQAGRWNGDAPAPRISEDIVRITSERYLNAYRLITGQALEADAA